MVSIMRRKENKKVLLGLFAFLVMAMLLIVQGQAIPCQAASNGKISKKTATLYVGETLRLKVTGGTGKVTWKSKKTKIAKVNKNGVVTAKKTGKCTITAKKGGVTYTCKVNVKKLPKNYAIINGKRIKVGKTITLKYKIQSKTPIAAISIKYKYDYDALEIVNGSDDSRYPTWICNEYYPESYDDDKSLCDICHLVGWDESRTDGFYWKDIACSSGKVMEVMKVKVKKTGNYKIGVDVYSAMTKDGEKVENYKITETVK